MPLLPDDALGFALKLWNRSQMEQQAALYEKGSIFSVNDPGCLRTAGAFCVCSRYGFAVTVRKSCDPNRTGVVPVPVVPGCPRTLTNVLVAEL